MPERIWVATEADALRLISKETEGQQFRKLTETTTDLLAYLLSRKPLMVLEHAGDWSRILDVLTWFCAHPRANLYLRQADIPGVDT